MGSTGLAVLDGKGVRVARLLRRVPGWFAVWEERLGRFVPDSELCRLNLAAGRRFRSSADLRLCLRAAIDAARWTGGLVVPTLLSAVEATGYDQSFERVRGSPHPRLAADTTAAGAWRGIRIGPHRGTILLPAAARVDLGGIAKGWSADQAASRLSRLGPALVSVGGDIACSGLQRDGARWPVGVLPPVGSSRLEDGDEPLEIFLIGRHGVATSGRDFRRWRRGREWVHHIIDPRTCAPARTNVLTATVIARTAAEGEAAAKAALILGGRQGLAFIEARAHLAALLILEDGRVLRSRRLSAFTG